MCVVHIIIIRKPSILLNKCDLSLVLKLWLLKSHLVKGIEGLLM